MSPCCRLTWILLCCCITLTFAIPHSNSKSQDHISLDIEIDDIESTPSVALLIDTMAYNESHWSFIEEFCNTSPLDSIPIRTLQGHEMGTFYRGEPLQLSVKDSIEPLIENTTFVILTLPSFIVNHLQSLYYQPSLIRAFFIPTASLSVEEQQALLLLLQQPWISLTRHPSLPAHVQFLPDPVLLVPFVSLSGLKHPIVRLLAILPHLPKPRHESTESSSICIWHWVWYVATRPTVWTLNAMLFPWRVSWHVSYFVAESMAKGMAILLEHYASYEEDKLLLNK